MTRSTVAALIYFVLYVLGDWVTYVHPALSIGITPWNPQAGLTVAFLVTFGPRWALVTVAAVLCCETWIHGTPGSPLLLLAASGWIGLIYALLAMIFRRLNLSTPLDTARGSAWLVFLSVAASLGVAAGYVGLFVVAGTLSSDVALRGMLRYWFGDLNGILMLSPLLLHTAGWREALLSARDHRTEMPLQAASVLLALAVIFALPDDAQLRFFSLLFVPVIWIALRWGFRGAILAVFVVQIGLIVAARADIHTPRFIDLQFLLVTLSLTALLLGAVVAERARDALERRRAEQQLREQDATLSRAMRFAVAGELASALTHELNQPITALVSYLQAGEILAAKGTNNDVRLGATLGKATQEARRASEVLRRLREFYRGSPLQRDRIVLPALCESVVHGFQSQLRTSGIEFAMTLDPSMPDISGDRTHLGIALHNLIANAVEVLESSTVSRRCIQLSASWDEDAVTLRLEDSGVGVSAEVGANLFEPFVTSKPDGMGLGLAISRSLLRSGGGDLSWGRSVQLGGAAFVLTIPIVNRHGTSIAR